MPYYEGIQQALRRLSYFADSLVERRTVVLRRRPEATHFADVLQGRGVNVLSVNRVDVRRSEGLDAAAHTGSLGS